LLVRSSNFARLVSFIVLSTRPLFTIDISNRSECAPQMTAFNPLPVSSCKSTSSFDWTIVHTIGISIDCDSPTHAIHIPPTHLHLHNLSIDCGSSTPCPSLLLSLWLLGLALPVLSLPFNQSLCITIIDFDSLVRCFT
jgi:hypothetical protein